MISGNSFQTGVVLVPVEVPVGASHARDERSMGHAADACLRRGRVPLNSPKFVGYFLAA